jgi:D-serine deaminase-like pyridoxal phosphate-dependent protein
MVDNEAHIDALEARNVSCEGRMQRKWSIFIKVDVGTHRAGIPLSSPRLKELIVRANQSSVVQISGVYCHAGHSYGCKSIDEASFVLFQEIAAATAAAELMGPGEPLILSVGATPTVHAAMLVEVSRLRRGLPEAWKLELHGGNFPVNDLQQLSTNCIEPDQLAMRVLAEICSIYPERNEALLNAGAIALSRETSGGYLGFGFPEMTQNWRVGRLSQEHGILVANMAEQGKVERVEEVWQVGQKVLLLVQHACITASAHGYFFVVDEQGIVREIWYPWKGW